LSNLPITYSRKRPLLTSGTIFSPLEEINACEDTIMRAGILESELMEMERNLEMIKRRRLTGAPRSMKKKREV
jgi:hypothetical protein